MTPGEAKYEQIAAALRQKITSGLLRPGDRMPSERALAAEMDIAPNTAARALSLLRAEGLVTSQGRDGSFVLERKPLRIRTSTRYLRRKDGLPPFASDAVTEGQVATWGEPPSARVRASEDVARRLDIQAGDHVMETRYVYRIDGHPTQVVTSWEPYAIVGGTAVEDAERGDLRGVVNRMDSIGVFIDYAVELRSSRVATEDERRALELGLGASVDEIERTHWAGTRPAETADIIIPTGTYRDEHVIAIPLPPGMDPNPPNT